MMKVGVLTFHRSTNFGTVLQAKATIELLNNLGAEAELIDYRPEYIESTLKVRKLPDACDFKTLVSIIANAMIYGNQFAEKCIRFKEYIETIKTSNTVCHTINDVERIARNYDMIISGSDQLWNERITGNDMTYFLPFKHPNKISYGSSFGVSHIKPERWAKIVPYLHDMRYIGLREETAVKLINELKVPELFSKTTRVIDPTLMVDNSFWRNEMNSSIELPKQGYILTYYMIETPLLRAVTRKLQKQTGLPLVNINPSKRQMILHEGQNLIWAGPREFLRCYADAKYVVTNSFHGTAFAINFEVPMFVTPLPFSMAGEVNSRLTDVLSLYGLKDRWIDSSEKVNQIHDISSLTGLSEIKKSAEKASAEFLQRAIRGDLYE
jgi:hypothetical protein